MASVTTLSIFIFVKLARNKKLFPTDVVFSPKSILHKRPNFEDTLDIVWIVFVVADKKAFFVVSTSEVGPQIYELVAHTTEEKKKWDHLFS